MNDYNKSHKFIYINIFVIFVFLCMFLCYAGIYHNQIYSEISEDCSEFTGQSELYLLKSFDDLEIVSNYNFASEDNLELTIYYKENNSYYATISEDKKGIYLTYDEAHLQLAIDTFEVSESQFTEDTYYISGFDQEITSVETANFGTGVTNQYYLFIMSDGRVMYINAFDMFIYDDFVVTGYLEDAENIIDVKSGTVYNSNNNESWPDTFLISSDDKVYLFSELLSTSS